MDQAGSANRPICDKFRGRDYQDLEQVLLVFIRAGYPENRGLQGDIQSHFREEVIRQIYVLAQSLHPIYLLLE